MKNKNYLITGSAGFIGFHLSKKLLSEGFNVLGVDNLNNYYDLKLKQDRIKILKTDVDNFNSGKYDLILSNPPYIDKHQLKYLGVCEYEPHKALDGGINGIEILKKVIFKASKLLKTNGKLIVEIGSNQKYKVKSLLNNNNFFVNKIIKDLSGHDRCLISTKKP